MNITYTGLLFGVVFLPFFGGISLFLLSLCFSKGVQKSFSRFYGLFITLITFFLSLFLWVGFDLSSAKFQFVQKFVWISSSNFFITFGIDGISLFFVLLTTFLMPVCLLASWNLPSKNLRNFFVAFLFMESFILIVFTVLDLLVFYVFFESVLIPMFLVIGVWGSRERKVRAAYFFFLYTLLGSVFMLLSLLMLYFETGSMDYQVLVHQVIPSNKQYLLWLGFFVSFAVKVPMVPGHIWLPEAHVEAPTAGSMILAGILLKLGTYGLVRFSLPLFPCASIYFTPLVYTLAAVGIVYTSFTAIRQSDMKRIIAYASVAHMNLTVVGLFSFSSLGIEGSILQMISHGLVSVALFLCIGVLYDRHHSRLVKYYSGLAHTMPLYATVFLFFTMANIGLPGTSSFVGEFMILLGIFQTNTFITAISGTTMVLGGAYSLWLYNRIIYGNIKGQFIGFSLDLNKREFFIFFPLICLTVVMGVCPNIFLDCMHISCINLINNVFES